MGSYVQKKHERSYLLGLCSIFVLSQYTNRQENTFLPFVIVQVLDAKDT
jgi:hypothetical protein